MAKHETQKPRVRVTLRAPDAGTVFIAGCFNDWSTTSHPMTKSETGEWTVSLDLPPGTYEYKFIVDGQWCCEVGCDEPHSGCPNCLPNAFGTMNRVLLVSNDGQVIQP